MKFNARFLAATLALPAFACSKSAPSAPATPPTLTSISPTSGVRGTTVLVTFIGQHFVVGSTQVSATAGLVGTGVAQSTTSITENVQITPGAPLGDAEFAVTTGAAHSDPLVFTVLPPAPTLTDVTPDVGARGATVAVTLTGTNFIAGATTVSVNGVGVTTNTVAVTSGSSLTVNLVIAADAILGADPIKVTTAGGASGTQPFIVDTLAPLTSRMPKRS